MITVTGRVVDENLSKMPGLVVQAVGEWLLTSKVLASDTTDSAGQFVLQVQEILGFEDVPRPFNLRVTDPTTKRVLTKDKLLSGSDKNQALGDITVNSIEATGLLVTNGAGVADFVSDDNAVKLLVDGVEAFGQVAEDIKNAKQTINITQLFFSLPKKFNRDPSQEAPELIFNFFAPDLVPSDPLLPTPATPQPRGVTNKTKDERPERLLVNAALANRKIHLLLNEPSIAWPEGIFWIAVLGPLAVGLGAEVATGLLALIGIGLPFFFIALALVVVAMVEVEKFLDDQTHVDEARNYFAKAIADGVHLSPPVIADILIRGFRQNLPKDGVFHCKMMITDEERAVVIGSPFKQRYFDSVQHSIADAHRGINSSDAIHDLSVSVAGPAVRHLNDSFLFFWNEDIEAGKLQNNNPKEPKAPANFTDPLCKVQVVRTLNGTRFAKLDGKSEKGILEGYLRAFAEAEHYIYLENQYFTDSVITEALVEVLKKKTDLELIMVVPIKPDVYFYPRRQACRIAQIREAGGDRVGIFTRWAYDETRTRPWVAPVYIHAKGGVVDDSWATVGSANLDGLSLDYNLLLSPLAFGETTATELNVNIIPPTKGAITSFAEQMRKRLFAEQLGIVDAAGKFNPTDPLLQPGPSHKWLKDLWRPRAQANLDHVKAGLKKPLPGFVLEYPKEDGGCLDTPRKHLKALGVNTDLRTGVIRPITGTRSFHFDTGSWDKKPEREDFDGALP